MVLHFAYLEIRKIRKVFQIMLEVLALSQFNRKETQMSQYIKDIVKHIENKT